MICMYGRKAIDFFFTGRVVRKPVISTRAIAAISLTFSISAALAIIYSPRMQAPSYPPTNVIRCMPLRPCLLLRISL
jgi:hypothetical protein